MKKRAMEAVGFSWNPNCNQSDTMQLGHNVQRIYLTAERTTKSCEKEMELI